ncbi:hypothetical protein TIFTF001_022975 [Ficus carica]|uniref:Retrotransposon gag domain-containing protein n=1 Tax=Ficus carica TaxID=3494 RepID=A0AA88ADP9_FICCA|nr:hypothetical protein TIFTF001_022975 [Ficus carica]
MGRVQDETEVIAEPNFAKRIWWEEIELSMDVNQMTWQEFLQEFNEQYFNTSVTKEHYDEFNNFHQGKLSMTEAAKPLGR